VPLRFQLAKARRRGHLVSISHLVEGPIVSAGYPVAFALVGDESLGVPLPGETALVLASIYAGTTIGCPHGWSPPLRPAAPLPATTSASG